MPLGIKYPTFAVNEAMLTGESVPVTKTSIRSKPSNEETVEQYNHREHAKNTLFRGTSVIQTRNYKDCKTKAVVIRTGADNIISLKLCQ